MKYQIYIILLLLLITDKAMCQDPVFSQFYHNKLYLNPSYAGEDKDHNAHAYLSYRNQWPDLPSSFVDYSASYDQKVDFLHGGIGLHVMNEVQGDGIFNDFQGSFIYSYNLKLARFTNLFAGFQATYFLRSLNASKLQFADMFDYTSGNFNYTTSENIASRNSGIFDFSSGFLLRHWNYRRNKYFYLGAVIHHLTEPKLFNDNENRLPRKYSVHINYNFPIIYNSLGFEEVRFNPFILYQKQHKSDLLTYQALFLLDKYSVGIGLRNNLQFQFVTFLFSVGINAQNLHIGYSYDLLPTKNNLTISKFGAHEVTFLLNLQYKEKRY